MAEVESLAERARRNKRKRDGLPEPVAEETPKWDPSLIPDPSTSTRSREDSEVDTLVRGISIVEAFNKWVNKPAIGSERKGENQGSCPIPGHDDSKWSASLDTVKNVWNCYVCDQGGDIYDLAAYHFGYAVPGYKKNGTFPKLKLLIAQDFGYVVSHSSISGKDYVTRASSDVPSDASEIAPDQGVLGGELTPGPARPEDPPSNVVELSFDEEAYQSEVYKQLYTIDWRSLFPNNTFMRRWCEIGSQDDLPEEFYVWLGLCIVGCGIGRATRLIDSPPVYGNLFLSLLGPSGMGKSKAIKAAIHFLRDALPYDDGHLAGTMIVPSPASAEALIDNFAGVIEDDTGAIVGYRHIRGIVRFDEFATLTARSNRVGSSMKPTLMEFFDAYDTVELRGRTSGLVKAVEPFCTVITTTQPRTLTQIFAQADADSGFLNRWIFARGVSKALIPALSIPLDFTDCIELIRDIRAWSSSHKEVHFDAGGFEAWSKFFRTHLEPLRNSDKAILARVDLQLKKVILLLCADAHEPIANAEIVERAIRLYDYLVATYGEISETLGMGELEECIRALEGKMLKWKTMAKPDPTARDFYRSLPRYPKEMIVRALSVMVAAGMVDEYAVESTRGRAAKRYMHVT